MKNIEEFESVKDSIFRALSQGKEESADTKQKEKDIKKGVKSLKLDLDLNSLAKTMEEIEAHKNVEHNHDCEEEDDNFDIQCESVEDERLSMFKMTDPPLTERGPINKGGHMKKISKTKENLTKSLEFYKLIGETRPLHSKTVHLDKKKVVSSTSKGISSMEDEDVKSLKSH